MGQAEMVRETPFVKPGATCRDRQLAAVRGGIAPLNNAGEVGDRVSIKNGFAVPLLVERRDPRVPDFAEVRGQVAERVRAERAKSQLEQTARDLAANTNSAGDLKAAAERLGLKAETADAFKLDSSLGQLGVSAAADAAINNLKAGEVTKTPVKIGETWVVVGATKRTDADLAEFAKQREQLTEQALSESRIGVYEDYLTNARQRLERDGDVEVYENVLAKLAADQPAAGAPFPGGAPFSIPGGQ